MLVDWPLRLILVGGLTFSPVNSQDTGFGPTATPAVILTVVPYHHDAPVRIESAQSTSAALYHSLTVGSNARTVVRTITVAVSFLDRTNGRREEWARRVISVDLPPRASRLVVINAIPTEMARHLLDRQGVSTVVAQLAVVGALLDDGSSWSATPTEVGVSSTDPMNTRGSCTRSSREARSVFTRIVLKQMASEDQIRSFRCASSPDCTYCITTSTSCSVQPCIPLGSPCPGCAKTTCAWVP